MEYSEDLRAERFALVISGDGRLEKRILAGLASKFNGKSASLFYPSRAMKGSTTGLPALLRGLKVAASIPPKDEMHALLLIDKEHIGDPNKIPETASEIGCRFEIRSSHAAFINGIMRIGPKTVTTFVAVVGREKCAEEEVACLIKLTFGDSVAANKADIRQCLNAHGTSFDDLLARATTRQLKDSFVGICVAIEALEHELS